MKFTSQIAILLSLLSPQETHGFMTGKSHDIDIASSSNLHSSTLSGERNFESLPLPPSRKRGPFRGLRESISYLSNGKRFVRKRAEELGDVFLTNIYFQPTVVIGGQEAVKEFVSGAELKNSVIYSALPETFKELHTKWGSLNLDANDTQFKQVRGLFADVFKKGSFAEYTPIINEAMENYVQSLQDRAQSNPEEEIFLVPELENLSLQIFAEIFAGEGLTDEQAQMFRDYNAALLALPFEKKKFEKGQEALKLLKEEFLARYKKAKASGKDHYYFELLEGREGFDIEDRICSGIVVFIWGAYIECAALMANSLVAVNKHDGTAHADMVLQELESQKSKGLSDSDLSFWDDGFDYTLGILRESLRLVPPGGGTPRYSKQDFEFRGYRIPAGTSVILDPRIGNTDPNLFVEPEQFQPTRWVREGSSASSSGCPFQGTALKLGFGSWFPGGFGAHQCPGVPLAELTSKIFLAKTVKAFDKWTFESGTTKDGEVKYNEIPIKIPVDNLGVRFSPRTADVVAETKLL